MRVFLDANIVMYAAGRAHPHKEPAIRLLRQVVQGECQAISDTEMLQELLYRYWHVKLLEEGLRLVDQAIQIIPLVLPVAKADVLLAKDLMTQHPAVPPRDAVHAAVMLNHGITHLYSYDHHFDAIPGLKRLEPS